MIDGTRIPCHAKSISETEALLGLQGQGNERLPLNPTLPRKEDAQGQRAPQLNIYTQTGFLLRPDISTLVVLSALVFTR